MPSDYAALDSLVAQLRNANNDWSVGDLANMMGNVLSSIIKQPTFNRGLHDDVIADANGGTKLSTTDNSAGWQSTPLQLPQRMHLRKEGTVATRSQARALVQTRTVSAKVISTSEGSVRLALSGNRPKVNSASFTDTTKAGDPMNDMSQDSGYLESYGDVMDVTLAGNPFITTDVDGTEYPTEGQTVLVSIAEEKEMRTIWHNRNGRNFPRVTENTSSYAATMVNGLCCHHEGDGDPIGPGGS